MFVYYVPVNLYSVVLTLTADPRSVNPDMRQELAEQLPTKASFCRDGEGNPAVCFDNVAAANEEEARFAAFRLWDHLEELTGVTGFKSHAIRDIMAEQRRDLP